MEEGDIGVARDVERLVERMNAIQAAQELAMPDHEREFTTREAKISSDKPNVQGRCDSGVNTPILSSQALFSVISINYDSRRCDGPPPMPSMDWTNSYGCFWRFGALDHYYRQSRWLFWCISGYS